MGFKAPETKQSTARPTDRNANSSLNKNVSVTRVITPGGKKDTEMTKNNRPGQSKIAKERVKSPSPERKTRGATRQSSASRPEDRDTEEKNDKSKLNRSRSQTKSQERSIPEPKSSNKTDKSKKRPKER